MSKLNRQERGQRAIRWLSHLAIWSVVLYPVAVEMQRGWKAVQDNATIAIRSYQVLSLHPPLVGQLSSISHWSHVPIYDPGPLQYFLLALPVHIDGTYGALWGAAILGGLALSLAVEALWRTGHRWSCAVVGAVAINCAYLIPTGFAQPTWNPYFAFLFLASCIPLAWVVAGGSYRWWPCLVFVASVAVESEAFFLYLAVGLVIGAPLIGIIAHRPTRLRWLAIGGIVAAVCWFPPAFQEMYGAHPNLSLLVSHHSVGGSLGVSFGLKTLAFAGSPVPIWVTGAPFWTKGVNPSDFYYQLFGSQPLVVGAIVLLMCGTIAVLAWRTHRHSLATLAGIGLIASLGVVAAFASAPNSLLQSLFYLDRILWPIGILLWIIALWAVAEVAKVIGTRSNLPTFLKPRADLSPDIRTITRWSVALFLVMAVVGSASDARELESAAVLQTDASQIRLTGHLATLIEHATPRGPVSIQIHSSNPDWFADYGAVQGAAWQLTSDGWRPALPSTYSAFSGITYPSQSSWPLVEVAIAGNMTRVQRVR